MTKRPRRYPGQQVVLTKATNEPIVRHSPGFPRRRRRGGQLFGERIPDSESGRTSNRTDILWRSSQLTGSWNPSTAAENTRLP